MKTIIGDLSNYIIIIIAAFYTLSCFTVFRHKDEKKQNRILNRQFTRLMFLHLICYIVLFVQMEDMRVIYIYGAQAAVLILSRTIYFMLYPQASRLIHNNMSFLMIAGLTMITRLNLSLAIRQIIFIIVGTVVGFSVPFFIIRMKNINNIGLILGAAGILLLSTVFIMGVTKNGSTNWIEIGSENLSISLQPSEFAKIIFVFFVAAMLSKSIEFKQVVITTAIAAVYVIILVLEKDLGGALVFFMVYLVMLFVATNSKFYFFSGLLAGSAAAYIAYFLFEHVRVRVANWRDPWSRIDTGGYQVAQSLFAIGTGSWFGVGICQGMPDHIPIPESDFIFSAIAEEMGVLFALCMILVCVSCFIMFVMVAMRTKRTFYKMLAMGFGMCYIFQLFLNIGGVTKFIPSTGVTLPLVSYGGSSILSSIIIFNLIQGVYIIAAREEEAIYEQHRKEQEAFLQQQQRR